MNAQNVHTRVCVCKFGHFGSGIFDIENLGSLANECFGT